jgi:hypothetical protein
MFAAQLKEDRCRDAPTGEPRQKAEAVFIHNSGGAGVLFRTSVAESLGCFAWARSAIFASAITAALISCREYANEEEIGFAVPLRWPGRFVVRCIHQAIEGRQKCRHAEVGIPTTQPILGVADEDSPDYRADRAYLALSPHRSVASRTEARHHAGRMEGKREHAQARPGDLQL